MPNIAFFIKKLAPHIERKHIVYSQLDEIHNITLLGDSHFYVDLSESSLYIGEDTAVADFLTDYSVDRKATIFVSGSVMKLASWLQASNINLIITDLPLVDLYNRINGILQSYLRWDRFLLQALQQGKDISEIVDTASELLGGHILLFNSGMHLIVHSAKTYFPDALFQEIIETGYFSYQTMRQLERNVKNSPQYTNAVHHICPDDSDLQIYLYPIRYQGMDVAILIFTIGTSDCLFDVSDMIFYMGNMLRPLLIQNHMDWNRLDNAFSKLLNDFNIENPLKPLEIRDRICLLEHPVKLYIRCIIITFQNGSNEMTAKLLLRRLTEIFTDTNMTYYDDRIVILFSTDTQEHKNITSIDMQIFEQLLLEYHAWALISNATRSYEMFFTIYYLASRLSGILTEISIVDTDRTILFFEDYTVYLIIDFAASEYQRVTGDANIIHFVSPIIVTLTRYDHKYNSNLKEVLYHYLSNGRSVAKTAETMYMHRNTVLNKLKRIHELCPSALEDGKSAEILMLSCQITEFYEKYLKLNLRI